MKYFKPHSLTWWASFAPLLAGVIVALADVVPGLGQARDVINALSGDMQPALLVNMGLAGIGLRAAL